MNLIDALARSKNPLAIAITSWPEMQHPLAHERQVDVAAAFASVAVPRPEDDSTMTALRRQAAQLATELGGGEGGDIRGAYSTMFLAEFYSFGAALHNENYDLASAFDQWFKELQERIASLPFGRL
jgi:hypothetical protein